MPPCDPNLSQPTGNHRSVRLTRSVRRAAGFVQVRFWEVKSISYSSESDSGPMAIDSRVTIPSKSSSPYGSAQNRDSPNAPAIRTEQKNLHLHAMVVC